MNYERAFTVAVYFCVIAQISHQPHETKTVANTCSYILGVVYNAVVLYEPLVSFAKARANGVRKIVAEHGFIGVLTGGLAATSGGISLRWFSVI